MMKMRLVKELSPQTVIVEVKGDGFEGRKILSREDYLAGKVTFEAWKIESEMRKPSRRGGHRSNR
jgi:hypothetical protein